MGKGTVLLSEASSRLCHLPNTLLVILHGLVLSNTEYNCKDDLMKKHLLRSCSFCRLTPWFSLLLKFLNLSLVLHPMQRDGMK